MKKILICLIALTFPAAFAADVVDPDVLDELDERIQSLAQKVEANDGTAKRVLQTRLENAEEERTIKLHAYAASVIAETPEEVDPRLETLMTLEPARIRSRLDRIIEDVVLPRGNESAAEIAAINAQLQTVLVRADQWYDALLRNLELSKSLGLDVAEEEQRIRRSVEERAANASAYLDMTLRDVEQLRERARMLPEDTEVQALYRVSTRLVTIISGELEVVINTMEQLGLNSSQYRAQLIAATGSISKGLLSEGVAANLVSQWLEAITQWVDANGARMIFNLLLFLVIVAISRLLAGWVRRATEALLRLSKSPMSQLLQRMIVSTAGSSVYALGILIALSQIGISLGPLLAGLGIAGFIVGFALQDTLSNFASGMMILFYRPFDVGDVIDTQGIFGKVSQMSLVNTTIMTFDNQTLIVPNTKIWGNVITNVTAQKIRRVDLVFGVSYASDIPKVEAVLQDVLQQEERVLDEPPPAVKVHELADSSVNFICRPWVNTDDYWDVYWDLMKAVKMRFDEEGISIPFPQRDVHMIPPPELGSE